jgi:hypothetical protein
LSPYRWTVRVPLTAIRIGNQSFELAAPSVCPSREAAAMEEADITPESFSGDISLEEMEASCWGAALTPDISSGTTGLHDLVSALRTRVRSVLLPLANIAPTKNKTIVRPA